MLDSMEDDPLMESSAVFINCSMSKKSFAGSHVIALLIVVSCASSLRAQVKQRPLHIIDSIPATVYPAIFYPRNPNPGEVVVALNLNLTIAPREIVRDEIRQIPQLGLAMRLGLPDHFGLGLRLGTNVIANQLAVIPSWSYSTGVFSFAVYNSSALWLGIADFTGFKTFAMGFSNAPGFTAGFGVDDFLASFGFEAITNYWHYTKFGTDVVHRQIAEFEGEAYTFTIEQDAFGGRRINWGVRFEYTTPGYQLWLAFNDTRKRSLTPSFFFGMIL
jgi:hypothetical protein